MEASAGDPFGLACERLTRLADLRQKDLVDKAEYEELRGQLLAEIKRSALPANEGLASRGTRTPSETFQAEPNYGYLHAQIVKRIREAYEDSGQDGKQMSLRALAEIANRRALEEGESVRIERLVDEVYKPLSGNAYTEEAAVQVLDRVSSVTKISLEIVSLPRASAAAKAIAGVTQESASEAAMEITKKVREGQEQKKKGAATPNEDLDALWKSLVGQDLWGALNGASSAVTVTLPLLASPPLGWTLAIAAAVGAVIGGGVQSGDAYGKRKRDQG